MSGLSGEKFFSTYDCSMQNLLRPLFVLHFVTVTRCCFVVANKHE